MFGGIVLGELSTLAGAGLYGAAALAAALTAAVLFARRRSGRGGTDRIPALLFAVCLIAGGARMLSAQAPLPAETELAGKDRTEITLVGTVTRTEVRGDTVWIYLRLREGGAPGAPAAVIVRTPRDAAAEYLPGQVLRAAGRFSLPRGARNEGCFDYRAYYRARWIVGSLDASDTLPAVEGGRPLPVSAALQRIRLRLSEDLGRLASEETAGVCRSILLGERWETPRDVRELLRSGGMGHLLAISGLHISMIGMALYRLLRKRIGSLALCGLTAGTMVWLYARMVGETPGAVRAAAMFAVQLHAYTTGRSYDSLSALSLSGILALAARPLLLLDSGFLLSYAAILGIDLLLPAFQRAAEGLPRRMDGLLGSLAVSYGTLPVLLGAYYAFPLQSLLLNFLLLPLFVLVVGCGGAGLLIGLLIPAAGRVLLRPAGLVMDLYLLACGAAAGPFPAVLTGKPYLWQLGLYLAGLCAWRAALLRRCRTGTAPNGDGSGLTGAQKGDEGEQAQAGPPSADDLEEFLPYLRRRKVLRAMVRAALLPVPLVLSLCLFSLRPQAPALRISMLDIGQGDCLFLQAADGETMLIDGGSSDLADPAASVLRPYLDAKRIRRVDAALITHMDADHTNGILPLLEEGRIRRLYVTPQILRHPQWPQWEPYVRTDGTGPEEDGSGPEKNGTGPEEDEKRAELAVIEADSEFFLGETRMTVLWPDGAERYLTDNGASAVVRLEEGSFSMLFTGDLEEAGEQAVLSRGEPGPVTVLKVAHHGSRSGTGEAFLERVRPRIALISCGAHSRYGHPHAETIGRLEAAGARIYATPSCGEIRLTVRGGRFEIRPFYPDRGGTEP